MANLIHTTFQIRRDTKENWETENPILKQGEPALATDTGELRIGDGVSQWSSLINVNEKDYTILKNKPQINGHELNGNQTNADLGIPTATSDLTNDSDFIAAGVVDQKDNVVLANAEAYTNLELAKRPIDQTFNPKSKNAQSGTAVEQARTSAVKESAVYTDSIKVNLDDEINFLTGEVSDAKQEIDKAVHTTLNVEIEDDGFGGYRADYNDNDINNHRNAGGLVQAKYYDADKNQTYTYYYSTMESDRKPTFIRTYINEQGQTEQVLASVGNDKKVTVERRIAKGTTDYTALENKPSINNVELSGNKTNRDLSIPNIYVGDGEPPVGTDIQIDQNGEALQIPDRTSELFNDSDFTTTASVDEKLAKKADVEGKYELIETIEVKGSPTPQIKNPNPYQLKSMILYVKTPSDTKSKALNASIKFELKQDDVYSYFAEFVRTSVRKNRVFANVNGNKLEVVVSGGIERNATAVNPSIFIGIGESKYVKGFDLGLTENDEFLVGTIVEVWGIK